MLTVAPWPVGSGKEISGRPSPCVLPYPGLTRVSIYRTGICKPEIRIRSKPFIHRAPQWPPSAAKANGYPGQARAKQKGEQSPMTLQGTLLPAWQGKQSVKLCVKPVNARLGGGPNEKGIKKGAQQSPRQHPGTPPAWQGKQSVSFA